MIGIMESVDRVLAQNLGLHTDSPSLGDRMQLVSEGIARLKQINADLRAALEIADWGLSHYRVIPPEEVAKVRGVVQAVLAGRSIEQLDSTRRRI